MMATRWVANTPWPKLEVDQLVALRAEGHGPAEIARRLQRTESSVGTKIRALIRQGRLTPMPPKPPPSSRLPGAPKRERYTPQRAGAVTLDPLPSLQDE